LEYENGVANLSNNNFETIPDVIIDWVKEGIIKEINLDNNKLNSIPKDFTNLRNVTVLGNPLQSIPVEFHSDKWKKLKQYLTSVVEKTANWNIRKLIVVGEEGVGKTTLYLFHLSSSPHHILNHRHHHAHHKDHHHHHHHHYHHHHL
jgi:predicted NACHT family NTPase